MIWVPTDRALNDTLVKMAIIQSILESHRGLLSRDVTQLEICCRKLNPASLAQYKLEREVPGAGSSYLCVKHWAQCLVLVPI